MSDTKPTKSQDSFAFEPEYLEHGGVKHEFTGTLFVPTEDEMKRIESEQRAREVSPIAFAEPHLFVRQDVPRAKVKMNMRQAMSLRQRGV